MNDLPDGFGRERGLRLLREMLRIREFEDRCAELYGAGHIRGFLHLCDGEEAIAVGVMGQGHVEFGHGAAHQLQALGVAPVLTAVPASSTPPCNTAPNAGDLLYGISG